MKAIRKFNGKTVALLSAFAVAGIMVLQCANPVDKPPLTWRSKIEFPVSSLKDTFYLGEQMTKIFTGIKDEQIDILKTGRDSLHPGSTYDTTSPSRLVPDMIKGDTLVFSILRQDTQSYETHEDSMETKTFHPVIGLLTISNAPPVTGTIPLPGPAGNFNVSGTVVTPKIYEAIFDTSSPPIEITVTNRSSTAPITTCTITILDSSRVINNLAENNGTATVSFPVKGRSFAGGLPVQVTGTTALAAADKQLDLSFNCNGLIATRLKVDDHLISFKKTFINNYDLTDTVDVDYIDVADGFFNYSIVNYSPIKLMINANHLHLWRSSYCIGKSLQKVEDLKDLTAADTLQGYFGQSNGGSKLIAAHNSDRIFTQNLSSCRLFPLLDSTWNATANKWDYKSVSPVLYEVTPGFEAKGDTITISASDSLLFTISAPSFKFREFLGTAMEDYVRDNDTQSVQVPFPWNDESKADLRNNFVLKKVTADIFMTPGLPGDAFLDTLGVRYKLFIPGNTQDSSVASTKFVNLANGKRFRQQTEITSLVNQFPDSLRIKVRINVPKGTRMKAVNDLLPGDPNYSKYMGRMNIRTYDTVRMNALLEWKVIDTADLDLGTGKFKVAEALRFFKKMDRKIARFNTITNNHTNVYMKLYALVVPISQFNQLQALTLGQVWNYISTPDVARQNNVVNLLGANGILIPPRDSTKADSVVLDDWTINTIIFEDSCAWRWQARFLPKLDDALHDSDYIQLKSWLHLEGDNNTDSLLIW